MAISLCMTQGKNEKKIMRDFNSLSLRRFSKMLRERTRSAPIIVDLKSYGTKNNNNNTSCQTIFKSAQYILEHLELITVNVLNRNFFVLRAQNKK